MPVCWSSCAPDARPSGVRSARTSVVPGAVVDAVRAVEPASVDQADRRDAGVERRAARRELRDHARRGRAARDDVVDAGDVERGNRPRRPRRARPACRRRSPGRTSPSAAAMRHAITSALTFKHCRAPALVDCSVAEARDRPARSRGRAAARSSAGSASTGSPTKPRSTTAPSVVRRARRCASARPNPASTPVRPTARTPAATSAATRSVFADAGQHRDDGVERVARR